MKSYFQLPPPATWLLALALMAPAAHAAEDILIEDWSNPTPLFPTESWWGGATQTYVRDATQDADGNPNSGALKVTVGFDRVANGGNNQFSARRQLDVTPVDGSKYARLEFDLKYDASSVAQGATYGNLEVGIAHTDWSQAYFGTVTTPVGQNDWRRISLPVNQNNPLLNTLRDFHFKVWSGDASSGMTGTQIFWIDNVKLIAIPSTEPPPPPPTVTLEPTKPGLNLISSGAGQYNRQNIRTALPDYSWVGATAPVTYSVTIADYPALPNHTTHIYFVPGVDLPATLTDPDWNRPVCGVLAIANNADGTGYMSFAYKNHLANSNGPDGHFYWVDDNPADLYDGVTPPETLTGTGKGGRLGFVGGGSVRGKWSIRFDSDTTFTLTSPEGNTATGSFPNQATANLFSSNLYVYFGTVPGAETNIGNHAVLSQVAITGLTEDVVEDFSSQPLSSVFEKAASDAKGVQLITHPEVPYWLTWTLPAVGYIPQQSPTLGEDPTLPWLNINTTNVFTAKGRQWRLLETIELMDPARNFFQLAKPAAP